MKHTAASRVPDPCHHAAAVVPWFTTHRHISCTYIASRVDYRAEVSRRAILQVSGALLPSSCWYTVHTHSLTSSPFSLPQNPATPSLSLLLKILPLSHISRHAFCQYASITSPPASDGVRNVRLGHFLRRQHSRRNVFFLFLHYSLEPLRHSPELQILGWQQGLRSLRGSHRSRQQ